MAGVTHRPASPIAGADGQQSLAAACPILVRRKLFASGARLPDDNGVQIKQAHYGGL
jgi:hypothetical protein